MFVSPELFYARGLKPPCNPVELYNCLSIKVIRQPICRHEQLSLSWISFSLKTLRLSPFGLAGSGFSLPGTSPVRKSANETLSGSRLSEHEVRVKALLDFLLAQSTPPVALRACRRRLFAPRDSARPEIRCLG